MAKNQPINASTQVGVVNGLDEGYATLADLVAALPGGVGSTSVFALLTGADAGVLRHQDGDGNTVDVDLPAIVSAEASGAEAAVLLETALSGADVADATTAHIAALDGGDDLIVDIDGVGVRRVPVTAVMSAGGTDDQTAAEVPYTNTTSGLTAVNAQEAIDELAGDVAAVVHEQAATTAPTTRVDGTALVAGDEWKDTSGTAPYVTSTWDGAVWVTPAASAAGFDLSTVYNDATGRLDLSSIPTSVEVLSINWQAGAGGTGGVPTVVGGSNSGAGMTGGTAGTSGVMRLVRDTKVSASGPTVSWYAHVIHQGNSPLEVNDTDVGMDGATGIDFPTSLIQLAGDAGGGIHLIYKNA